MRDDFPWGWLCALVCGVAVVAYIMGGGSESGSGGAAASNNRSGTLSGNQVEVMSRNQLNLWSDVQNCYGDYSCMTVITSTTSTVQNTDASVNVDGDRNVVIGSNGDRLCEGDDGIYRLCEED